MHGVNTRGSFYRLALVALSSTHTSLQKKQWPQLNLGYRKGTSEELYSMPRVQWTFNTRGMQYTKSLSVVIHVAGSGKVSHCSDFLYCYQKTIRCF